MGGLDNVTFFVSALPRSRTAWLSVFLSQSGIHCYHDGMNGCSSISDYVDKVSGCGDSSTGLSLFDMTAIFPPSPMVIIDKSDEEFERCVEWVDLTYRYNSRDELSKQRDSLNKMSGLRVNQSDIDSRLQDIFEHLTSADWLPVYSDITSLNIQSDPFDIDMGAAKRLMNDSIL